MGYQAGINAALGTVAGAVLGVKKGLAERQKQANTKAAEVKKAKTEQKTRFRKSPILDKYGQNIMVPVNSEAGEKATKPESKKGSILLGADGRNLTNGK